MTFPDPDSLSIPLNITGKAHCYCILGNPVGHSMSPLMHNTAFRLRGLDAVYVPFEVSDLSEAVRSLKALGFKGASVTVPFKKEIMSFVDDLDEKAAKIGAVNTLVFDDGIVRGINTDWRGALRCLETLMPVSGNTFVVLGAGGAARAVVFAVVQGGGNVVVVNRSEERGRALAEAFSASFVPCDHIETVDGHCLVNTTPVGMYPRENTMPLDKQILGRYRAVADVVYNPMQTVLLREAEAAGCATASGFEMFIYQGVEQFQLWTGQKAPVEAMRRVVYERLCKQ
jgi:shikimate dehydrogenase